MVLRLYLGVHFLRRPNQLDSILFNSCDHIYFPSIFKSTETPCLTASCAPSSSRSPCLRALDFPCLIHIPCCPKPLPSTSGAHRFAAAEDRCVYLSAQQRLHDSFSLSFLRWRSRSTAGPSTVRVGRKLCQPKRWDIAQSAWDVSSRWRGGELHCPMSCKEILSSRAGHTNVHGSVPSIWYWSRWSTRPIEQVVHYLGHPVFQIHPHHAWVTQTS